jgi:RimJ/RimL family protein N-acetyltransferase
MSLVQKLHAPMHDDQGLMLAPLAEAHREGLRAACAADTEIWEIYPMSMLGDYFDPAFQLMFMPNRLAFVVLCNDIVIGTSSYFLDSFNAVAEIGGTYIMPAYRGTGLNDRMKYLMLARAFESGVATVQFAVDARNARSRAAVLKLGAQFDGLLRGDRLTWTGHRRDTCKYSILAAEWPTVEARLQERRS